mmetsp:Transcript_126618/g.405375  ORF Transcript_126618/g.405375 Transcript_126618/m.405375 type:complete len:216 (+) Transcript_126618:714-1361(+)
MPPKCSSSGSGRGGTRTCGSRRPMSSLQAGSCCTERSRSAAKRDCLIQDAGCCSCLSEMSPADSRPEASPLIMNSLYRARAPSEATVPRRRSVSRSPSERGCRCAARRRRAAAQASQSAQRSMCSMSFAARGLSSSPLPCRIGVGGEAAAEEADDGGGCCGAGAVDEAEGVAGKRPCIQPASPLSLTHPSKLWVCAKTSSPGLLIASARALSEGA